MQNKLSNYLISDNFWNHDLMGFLDDIFIAFEHFHSRIFICELFILLDDLIEMIQIMIDFNHMIYIYIEKKWRLILRLFKI